MLSIKNKNMLILGGISLSNEIIKHAKHLGVNVYVTDYKKDSPGKKFANKSFMVSTTDVEALVKLIEKEKIDGVLTGFVDLLLPYYQQVCVRTKKYCYATKEQIEILTNKHKFKQLCLRFDIPVVEEYNIKPPFSENELDILTYPLLLKPTDNSGGKGIFICNNPDDLILNYEKALSFSPRKQVLVERFITAPEVTIFYAAQDGKICLTAMGDRHTNHFYNNIIPLPVAYTFPSKYLYEYQKSLNHKVVDMFNHIGIKNGIIFIQSFIENGKCIFYEIGYRLTGSLEYKLINHACNIDLMDMMIKFALTGKMSDVEIICDINPNFDNYYCNITLIAKPGMIGEITGVKEVLEMPTVIDVVLSYEEGDIIPENALGTLAQVVVRVFAYEKTKQDLASTIEKIQNTINVFSPDGESILLPMYNTNELFK